MSSEIAHNYIAAKTLYACRFKANGEVFLTDGSASELWGTNGHDADDYDVTMPEKGTSGHYVGHFDASGNIADGDYKVVVYVQAAANPVDGDMAVAQGVIGWHSAASLSRRTALILILAAIAAVSGLVTTLPTKEEIRAEIDANSTQLALIVEDTNELQTDWTDGGRLDLLIDQIKAMTDLIAVVTTTVADSNDANGVMLSAGQDVNDAYWMHAIMIEDANDGHSEVRWIEIYDADRDVEFDEPLSFTPVAGDRAWVLGPVYGGLLQRLVSMLNTSQTPIYHFDQTDGSGGTDGQGGVTIFGSDGSDP